MGGSHFSNLVFCQRSRQHVAQLVALLNFGGRQRIAPFAAPGAEACALAFIVGVALPIPTAAVGVTLAAAVGAFLLVVVHFFRNAGGADMAVLMRHRITAAFAFVFHLHAPSPSLSALVV